MLPCGFKAQPTKPCCGALSTLSCPQSSSGTVTHCCWSPANISYCRDPRKTLTIRDVSPSRGVSVGEVTCLLWERRHLAVDTKQHYICLTCAALDQCWAHSIEGDTTIFPQPTFTGQQTSVMLQNVKMVPLCEWTIWMVQLDTADLRPTVREDFFKAAFLNSLLSQTWTPTQKLLKTL